MVFFKTRRMTSIRSMYILGIVNKGGDHVSTTIQNWGNSQGVRIPKKILQQLSWSTEEEIELIPDLEGGRLILSKVDSKNNYLEKLFEDYDGVYQTEEFDWGNAHGEETW